MATELDQLECRLEECLRRDRARLRRRLRALREREAQDLPVDRGLADLLAKVEQSAAARAERANRFAQITYPAELPIAERREEVARAIAEHQVVVVCGETGSGKSTQLPKICLELGRGVDGQIAHTQPRRIAARSIAQRLTQELGGVLGRDVGYKVRFQERSGPECLIKVLTDGMLLAETQGDRELRRYDTIIIDEAHERSLNIDFLLGYLKQLLPRRPDLKVIITSATIDPQRFSEHFDGAPIITVSGRAYPVETLYRPLDETIDDERERLQKGILAAVEELEGHQQGDILCFLPGEREIREATRGLEKHGPKGLEILPLFARLSVEDQQRIFQSGKGRRIVLATNVAETSLTVPGIRSVIDAGTARISRYSARNKVQRLEIEPVSRASADQRAGRCGRIGPGTCIRLYAEDDYAAREAFTQPEILRSHLAGVILQMKALQLGKVERFPFVEPPDARLIREGYRTLHELGAVDADDELTEIGRQLATLPIDPRIGRMILAAGEHECVREVLIIASALSIQDPRDRPAEKRDLADEAHEPFAHEDSDFLTYLNLWKEYHQQAKQLSSRKLARWCRERFLSPARMREWHDVRRQLRELTKPLGLHPKRDDAEPDAVHHALLAGLISNIGRLDEGHEYQGAHGTRFYLFPGSVLFSERPRWVMAAELVRTTRLYARTVAKIRPQWVEKYAGHLVTKRHGPPRWDRRRLRVVADESVSLYGLEIVPKREVHYGPIDPEVSRELFIHQALVEGDLRTRAPFMRHNKRLIEEVARLEERLRRRDLLADREARFRFYDERLPRDVYTAGAFEKWRREAERRNPKLLFMEGDEVFADSPAADELSRFPERIRAGGADLPVRYRFEPSASDDGVTVTVPAETFASIESEVTDWSVPGLVQQRVTDLIRTLPKSHRRQLGPAPQFVEAFLASDPPRDAPLTESLSRFASRSMGVTIPASAWRPHQVAQHLRMNYRVVDDKGNVLAEGRDPAQLRGQVRRALGREQEGLSDERWMRDGIETWDVGELPEEVEVERQGVRMIAYPALTDAGETAALRLYDRPELARTNHRAGVLRLLILSSTDDLRTLTRGLPDLEELGVFYAAMGAGEEIRADATRLLVERATLAGRPDPRDRAAFDAARGRLWDNFSAARHEVLPLLRRILELRQSLTLELDRPRPAAWSRAVEDMRVQLNGLVPPRFARRLPFDRLQHLPRYLQAMRSRLDKLSRGGFERDARAMIDLARALQLYSDAAAQVRETGAGEAELAEVRWMIEELRVSLFAQELGTPAPISLKRILRRLQPAAA